MADEVITETVNPAGIDQGMYKEYIEAINNLKNTTVSRDDYDSLLAERNSLIDNLVNGQRVSKDEAEVPLDVKERKVELFMPDHELSDMEYVERALDLRKTLLATTGEDCFVAEHSMQPPTQEDYVKAQKVADVLQECLDNCNGNNKQFIAALQSRMVDVSIPQIPRRK